MKPVAENKTRIILVDHTLNWWQMFVTCRSNIKQYQIIPLLLFKQKEQGKFEAPFVPGLFDPVLRIRRCQATEF